ncbi:MAG: ABC transporter permease [Bacteroidaceae bacterium]|nr:ABC transporter permease [Bacteroidaceae bacterium]
MNYELKTHNIRVAWRNLMKYKTQNIIAVLCLAVGLVLFSVTFIITQRIWQNWLREGGDPRRAKVELYAKQDSVAYIEPDIIQRINNSHLPSIDFIDINHSAAGINSPLIDLKGKRHNVYLEWQWISPEHLNYLKLRSAITGKRIPVLKPGDVIMTKGMLERTFGKGMNPIGFKVERTVNRQDTIMDVVDTGDWMLNEDKMLVVTDQLKECLMQEGQKSATYMRDVNIILAKGKTAEDLQKDLQKILPEYEVRAEGDFSFIDARALVLFMIVGSSVLLIGLFGFLKTQIQLFRLRQREMGLRQCMGAQRSQLFGLMMWEVAIVFFFVTLLTLVLTGMLADYAVPIMQKETNNTLIADMPRTYATELWICLATFLVTAGIAALSVRKVITTPLSEVVGKSHKMVNSKWLNGKSFGGRNLLIVLQMVVCQVLLFLILGTIVFFDANDVIEPTPSCAEAFRSSIVTQSEQWEYNFLDTIPHLQHIKGVTHVSAAYCQQDLKEGEEPLNPGGIWKENDGSRHCRYEELLTDEHLFGLLDLELYSSDTKAKNTTTGLVPVYAPAERADELRLKLGLKVAPTERRVFEKGKPAEKIGYVQAEPLISLSFHRSMLPSFIYICETDYFKLKDKYDYFELHAWDDFENFARGYGMRNHIILKAKPGESKLLWKELTNLHHEKGKFVLAKAPIDNLYDVCFNKLRAKEMILQIMLIMGAIAVLCIVLTLFSSVSLDTRGRQKEVAIRKVNGADAKKILWLFGKQYICQLIISSIISLFFCIGLAFMTLEEQFNFENTMEILAPYLCTVLFVALITLLTVGYKIYTVSQLNPAIIIKKE